MGSGNYSSAGKESLKRKKRPTGRSQRGATVDDAADYFLFTLDTARFVSLPFVAFS